MKTLKDVKKNTDVLRGEIEDIERKGQMEIPDLKKMM